MNIRPVYSHMDGVVYGKFESVTEAADHYGINAPQISEVLKGVKLTAGGLSWGYRRESIRQEVSRKRMETPSPVRVCRICRKTYPANLNHFYRLNKVGLRTACKSCHNKERTKNKTKETK